MSHKPHEIRLAFINVITYRDSMYITNADIVNLLWLLQNKYHIIVYMGESDIPPITCICTYAHTQKKTWIIYMCTMLKGNKKLNVNKYKNYPTHLVYVSSLS